LPRHQPQPAWDSGAGHTMSSSSRHVKSRSARSGTRLVCTAAVTRQRRSSGTADHADPCAHTCSVPCHGASPRMQSRTRAVAWPLLPPRTRCSSRTSRVCPRRQARAPRCCTRTRARTSDRATKTVSTRSGTFGGSETHLPSLALVVKKSCTPGHTAAVKESSSTTAPPCAQSRTRSRNVAASMSC
jgi:hypothetical protein